MLQSRVLSSRLFLRVTRQSSEDGIEISRDTVSNNNFGPFHVHAFFSLASALTFPKKCPFTLQGL